MQNQMTNEIIITRVFDAPRELVFRAFSEPEQVRQWWGPTGWTMPVCTIDFRPGGEWRYCIRNAEGEEHCARAVYQKIVPMEQIVFRDEIVDNQGRPIVGQPSRQLTVIFNDLAGKTLLTVYVELGSTADLEKLLAMGFSKGFSEALNNLEQHLRQVQQSIK
jgi:uncharacterized protein YndB with AHSA1/START domain